MTPLFIELEIVEDDREEDDETGRSGFPTYAFKNGE